MMHIVCRGVVWKLLKFWLCGSLHNVADAASWLPAHYVQTLSNKLVKLACFIPWDLAHQPRAVSEVDR